MTSKERKEGLSELQTMTEMPSVVFGDLGVSIAGLVAESRLRWWLPSDRQPAVIQFPLVSMPIPFERSCIFTTSSSCEAGGSAMHVVPPRRIWRIRCEWQLYRLSKHLFDWSFLPLEESYFGVMGAPLGVVES